MIEIYSENGDLSLESRGTAITRLGGEVLLVSQSSGGTNVDRFSPWDQMLLTQPSSGTKIQASMEQYSHFFDDLNTPPDTSFWFRLTNGASAFVADVSRGFWDSWGTKPYYGANMGHSGSVYMQMAQKQPLNAYSGYLDAYDEIGQLSWSAASLAMAPQVVHIAYLPPTMLINSPGVSIDLGSFGVPVDRLFFLGPGQGRVSYDELFFDYLGVSANRIGNTLYLGTTYSSNVTFTVGQMFGSQGLYIPIAYFR